MFLFFFSLLGLTNVVHMVETKNEELALIWARLTYNPETSGQSIKLVLRPQVSPSNWFLDLRSVHQTSSETSGLST